MTKSYDDGQVLTESMLDDMKNSTETFLNSTKVASDNIQTGGVATTNLADGVLSADATGRAKMADGFLSADATGRAKVADSFVTTGKINDGALTADATGRAKMADSFVNAAKLAADAVTTAKILDSNVTGAKLEDDIVIPGTPSFAGAGFFGVANQVTTESALGIIRGTVNSDGSIYNGAGFSVSHPSTGLYTITFDTAFGAAGTSYPSVFVCLDEATDIGSHFLNVYNNAPGSFNLAIRVGVSGLTNAKFVFMAIGPKTTV
jgi:hypothetical protein